MVKIDGEATDGIVSAESGLGTLSISSADASGGSVGVTERPLVVSTVASEVSSENGMLVPASEVVDSTSESSSLVVVACPPAIPVSLSDSGESCSMLYT